MKKKSVLQWAATSLVLVILAEPILPEFPGLLVFFVSSIVLFFSLVTYRMKEEVFQSWWNYAYGWIVAIVAASLFFGIMGDSGGGWGISSGLGEFAVLVILYFFFIVGSFAKIIYKYLELKNKEYGAKFSSKKIYGIVYGITAIIVVSFLAWFFHPIWQY